MKVFGYEPSSEHDFSLLREHFQDKINSGLAPSEIASSLGIEYSDFGMFLKRCLNVRLLSSREALKNYNIKIGRANNDEKAKYWEACRFKFGILDYPMILGYNLISELGIYHPTNNPTGVSRDHMFSISEGYQLNIPADIISHPANCHIIPQRLNEVKNSNSSITYDALLERIELWNKNQYIQVVQELRKVKKSDSHKQKISESVSKQMCVTDGKVNLKILKTDPIPNGFRRGMTRKKMVP